MNDDAQNEHTEGWLSDKIIDEYIRTLLNTDDDYYQIMPGDKYKLSLDETKPRFKHGIMELPSASHSMFECVIMKDIDGRFEVYDTESKYVRVYLHGIPGKWYIRTDNLMTLLNECVDTEIKTCQRGTVVIALMQTDTKLLIRGR